MRNIGVVRVAKPRTPFMVAIPASTTGSKRVRRYFKDRESALAYVISVKQQGFLGAEGQQGTSSSSNSRVTLGECAALWIARHEQDRLGYFQIRMVLNRLVARHGRDPISAVDHRELDAWLRSLHGLAPVTQHNYWRVTRRFFNFCRDFLEVVTRNPMSKLQQPRLEHQDPAILTPEQMRACLAYCSEVQNHRLTAYLALGGFAGLRTAEILRQQWSDIDWDADEIYIRQPKRVGGWRPRHVEILPALRRHLEHLALSEGKVLSGGQRTLYLLRRQMMDRLTWDKWPNNCLRHSFKTYHAAHFRDLPRTQLQMGHSGIGMTAYVYGTPATRANAAAWWAL
jgi:integrase